MGVQEVVRARLFARRAFRPGGSLVPLHRNCIEYKIYLTTNSGGSTYKSFRRPPPPPTGPNSFVFTYVFTEKCRCRRLTPPPTRVSAPPPTGNPGSAPDKYGVFCSLALYLDPKLKTYPRESSQNKHIWSPIFIELSAMFSFLVTSLYYICHF